MVRRRQVLTVGGLTFGGLITVGGIAIAERRRAAPDAPRELRIATGPPGGVLRGMGAALATALRPKFPGTRIWLIPTDASLDNLALLRRGEADLGFAALDTAVGDQDPGEQTIENPPGNPTAEDRPGPAAAIGSQRSHAPVTGSGGADLTATARLFDSWMRVLVRADSSITQLRQLDGLAIAAGAAGSGTRFGLRRLVKLVNITPTLVTASQDEGAAALVSGSVDAFVTFSGVPTPAVVGLLRATRIRMLPLTFEGATMNHRFGGVYTSATLPATAYSGLAGISTFTTPNLLLVRPDLKDSVVRIITATLFDDRASIARDHPEASQINIRTGVQTAPIQLHPGAARYFRTVKP
jgi:TRAP-type uncharacterized transport system substrate-binding protein